MGRIIEEKIRTQNLSPENMSLQQHTYSVKAWSQEQRFSSLFLYFLLNLSSLSLSPLSNF